MSLAVDSSALFAIFKAEPTALAWVDLLADARVRGEPLWVCDVVAAEVSPLFATLGQLEEAIRKLGVRFSATSLEASHLAGQTFAAYHAQGGPREHLIPDFLIAAHAQLNGGRLAANDRGYYRRYFPGLKVVNPSR